MSVWRRRRSLLCDCSKILGQCAAPIKMKSLSGSKPPYTAKLGDSFAVVVLWHGVGYVREPGMWPVKGDSNVEGLQQRSIQRVWA